MHRWIDLSRLRMLPYLDLATVTLDAIPNVDGLNELTFYIGPFEAGIK